MTPVASDHNETTWTVGVNWEPSSGALHYAKISKGYKAGGFDAVGTYEPETNTAYEVGSKNEFGNSLFNIAGFYYDYKDLQASVLLDTTVGGQIFNAGKAEIYGIEAEYEVHLTDNDRLKLTANYLSATYKEFAPLEEAVQCVGGCDANTVPSDASGNTLPNAPELIFTLGYDHTWHFGGGGALTGSIFSRYKSDYYNSVFNYADSHQDAYTQTDASLEYVTEGNKWSFMIYGRNLENELPINYMNFISAGHNDDFNWVFGAPRTVGLRGVHLLTWTLACDASAHRGGRSFATLAHTGHETVSMHRVVVRRRDRRHGRARSQGRRVDCTAWSSICGATSPSPPFAGRSMKPDWN